MTGPGLSEEFSGYQFAGEIVTGLVRSSNAKSHSGAPDSIISAGLLRVGRRTATSAAIAFI